VKLLAKERVCWKAKEVNTQDEAGISVEIRADQMHATLAIRRGCSEEASVCVAEKEGRRYKKYPRELRSLTSV
jgi:hypothetical protein